MVSRVVCRRGVVFCLRLARRLCYSRQSMALARRVRCHTPRASYLRWLQDKRDGVSGRIFWEDLLQIRRVDGAAAISVDTLWRLFLVFNYRGGGYLSYREFVAACYVLVKQEDRLKQTLIFAAFCEDRGVHGRINTGELKSLLLELIVGNRTSEWRAYPRQNITMNDFDPLVTLMAEAAIAKVSPKWPSADNAYGGSGSGGGNTGAFGPPAAAGGGANSSASGGSGGDSNNDASGSLSAAGGDGLSSWTPAVSMDFEQWHKYAATQQHIQNLVAVLHAAGAGIREGSVTVPDDQGDYDE
jgi:hypothetical protein